MAERRPADVSHKHLSTLQMWACWLMDNDPARVARPVGRPAVSQLMSMPRNTDMVFNSAFKRFKLTLLYAGDWVVKEVLMIIRQLWASWLHLCTFIIIF